MHRLVRRFALAGCNPSLWVKVETVGVREMLSTSRSDHIRSFGGIVALEEVLNDALSKKKRLSRKERASVVESFVLKYLPLNQGKFPNASFVARETGGNRSQVKEILNELESRLKAEAATTDVYCKKLELDKKDIESSIREGIEMQATSSSASTNYSASDQHLVTVVTSNGDANDIANSMLKDADIVTSSGKSISEEKTLLKDQMTDSSNNKMSVWERLHAITFSGRERSCSQSSLEARSMGSSALENVHEKGMSYSHPLIKDGLSRKSLPEGRASTAEQINGGRRTLWAPLHAISAGQQSGAENLSDPHNKTEGGFRKALKKVVVVKDRKVKIFPQTSQKRSLHEFNSTINSPKPIGSNDRVEASSVVNDLKNIPRDNGYPVMVENVPTSILSEVKQALEKHGEILSSYYKADESIAAATLINFKTEEAKESALATHWIYLGGRPFLISRINSPKTTVVRISNISCETDEDRIVNACKSCGYFQKVEPRASGVVDVYFHPKESKNMIRILDRLNEVHMDKRRWQAQPAPRLATRAGAEFHSSADGQKWIRSKQFQLVEKFETAIKEALVNLEDLKELLYLQWHGRPSDSSEALSSSLISSTG